SITFTYSLIFMFISYLLFPALLSKCYLILLLTGWLYVQLFSTIIFLIPEYLPCLDFGKVDPGHKEKVEQSVFHKNISNVYILAPSIFKTLCEVGLTNTKEELDRRSRDSAV
ncbi:hypothetical protein ACJX0J_019613, partial [Zea mays]